MMKIRDIDGNILLTCTDDEYENFDTTLPGDEYEPLDEDDEDFLD